MYGYFGFDGYFLHKTASEQLLQYNTDDYVESLICQLFEANVNDFSGFHWRHHLCLPWSGLMSLYYGVYQLMRWLHEQVITSDVQVTVLKCAFVLVLDNLWQSPCLCRNWKFVFDNFEKLLNQDWTRTTVCSHLCRPKVDDIFWFTCILWFRQIFLFSCCGASEAFCVLSTPVLSVHRPSICIDSMHGLTNIVLLPVFHICRLPRMGLLDVTSGQ